MSTVSIPSWSKIIWILLGQKFLYFCFYFFQSAAKHFSPVCQSDDHLDQYLRQHTDWGVYNILGGSRFVHGMILGLDICPLLIILLMICILVFLGMFMDWIGIALLTMPIFVPIIIGLGYDPVWCGVVFCMNMQVSFLSPPFGPAAFYLKSVAPPEISLVDIFSSVWPFIIMQLIVLGLVVLNPNIALWLVNL